MSVVEEAEAQPTFEYLRQMEELEELRPDPPGGDPPVPARGT